MGSFGRFAGCALAALLPGACLLYTGPINEAPRVKDIVAPSAILADTPARFQALVVDPDGDVVTLLWSRVDKPCDAVTGEDWQTATPSVPSVLDTLDITLRRRERLCLRVVATDEHGAVGTSAPKEVMVTNRAPEATLDLLAPPAQTSPFRLYSTFRLSAAKSRDLDRDDLTYKWRLDRADVALGQCDERDDVTLRCFTATQPGPYTMTVVVDDGMATHERSLAVTVAEDQPPCLELTTPDLGTPFVSHPQPWSFTVLRVKDDGHPYPPERPVGGTPRFYWFIAQGELGEWRHVRGHDGPTFNVGLSWFDDPRPDSSLRVRVEVRDPAHDPDRLLQSTCMDSRVCVQPPGCVRWVGWTVKL